MQNKLYETSYFKAKVTEHLGNGNIAFTLSAVKHQYSNTDGSFTVDESNSFLSP